MILRVLSEEMRGFGRELVIGKLGFLS